MEITQNGIFPQITKFTELISSIIARVNNKPFLTKNKLYTSFPSNYDFQLNIDLLREPQSLRP